jgi:hypothetical protein
MAKISVGAAVGAGFGLIARRPLAVLAWGLPPTLFQVIVFSLIGPIYLSMISQMIASGGAAGTSSVMAMQPQLMQVQGLVQLLNLAQLFVSAVVYCAVFRAVLHPEKSAFGYFRVGAAELFLALLIFGAIIVWVIALIVVMIPVGILIAVVAVASHGAGAGLAILIPLIILALMIGIAFIALRFSFVGPMMVEDGKFHLFESWTLTRGRMGSLLLLALSLFGVFILLEIVIVAVLFGVGAAAIGAVGGVSELSALFRQSPRALLARIWPVLAVYAVLMVPVTGCALAIAGAPFARAYKDVALDPADASSAFV